MSEEAVPIFEISDSLATRCGNTLTATFVPGSTKIALSVYRPIKWSSRDTPSDTAGEDPVVISIAQESTLYKEPLLRSLLSETNGTFVTLQTLVQEAKGTKKSAEYLQISRAYRSIIRFCLEKLDHGKKTPEVQEDEWRLEHCTKATKTFYAIECMWHLFEILYLQQQQTSQVIVHHLLEWVRFHYPNTEDQATDLLLMAEEASECDSYWLTLRRLIMLGQLEVPRAILLQNRKFNQAAFQAAEQVLKTMPVYQDGYALHKFNSQWEYWHVDLDRKLAAQTFAAEPQLELIMQLVAGSNKHWDAELVNSQDWYEFLPGYLLYTKPTCKPFELRIATTHWLNRWSVLRPEWQMKQLSRMVLQLMQHDIKLFIYDAQKLNDSHWFSTHLIDLIYHTGQFKSYFDQQNVDLAALRHSMVFEYGSFLMASRNHWQLAIDYLDFCSHEGAAAIELLLPRIPLRSERQAFKVLELAKQRGLVTVEQDICKVLSKRAHSDQRYGSALEWAIRSKDVLLVTSLADFILKNYSHTGVIFSPDVLRSIGPRMFISPRLVFLCKYFEFYELYRQRDFVSAAEPLINLLASKITPAYFWPSLLIDAMPLLNSEEPKLFINETLAILQHLEMELVPLIERNKLNTAKFDNQTSKTIFKDYRVENVEEFVELMRLSCARNMVRATIIENRGPPT
ncbi:nuclear pore complex protein Nup75 [Drosophila grimshawi]|uniref:Nuclear pore complex protein Nup75 n=1 Tax=Drosophila grimshawi TaxID=7222 RepID=B4J5I7_DROGR|nr:nuclear pore complex protein Nup75 [Drosophila grimshawi]EDW00750.1 GH20846 [Drosophila grimshawi]